LKEERVLTYLERQTKLTAHQRLVIGTAMLGCLLEFFDYFLIGFVVAFIAGAWKLTFGQSAIVLLAPGVGAIVGAFFYGRLADRIGRRKVFAITVVNFSLATGALAFTPEHNWLFLAAFYVLTGFGGGGFYCVSLPLVQEVVPGSKRGFASGVVTSAVPLGPLFAALAAATLTPWIGWRGLFALGAGSGLLVLWLLRWVPESPRWLLRMGRTEEARRSLAWVLNMDVGDLPATAPYEPEARTRWADLFRYPRSLVVSWLVNLSGQTGVYGFQLWAPTLVVLVLGVEPRRAAFLMIWVNLAGFCGRVAFSFLSDAIGRRASAGIYGFGSAIMLILAAASHDLFIGSVSVFWLMLLLATLFLEGGFAIIGPYSAEVWPARMRTTGMGSAYGFGGLGKVIGPLGLALIVGASNVIRPQASLDAILPAYAYLASWFALAAIVMLAFARETKGRSLEALDRGLAEGPAVAAAARGEVPSTVSASTTDASYASSVPAGRNLR
jgi:putative MFS transporter